MTKKPLIFQTFDLTECVVPQHLTLGCRDVGIGKLEFMTITWLLCTKTCDRSIVQTLTLFYGNTSLAHISTTPAQPYPP